MKNIPLTLILATVIALPVCAQNSVDLGPNGPCPFKVDPSTSPSGLGPPSGFTPPVSGLTPTSGQTSPWRASPCTPASGVAPSPSGTSPDTTFRAWYNAHLRGTYDPALGKIYGPEPGTLIDSPIEQNQSVSTPPAITTNPVLVEPTKTKEQLEGERLGHVLGKAIVDYAIIGFGAVIGFLIVFVLMKKPKNAAAQKLDNP